MNHDNNHDKIDHGIWWERTDAAGRDIPPPRKYRDRMYGYELAYLGHPTPPRANPDVIHGWIAGREARIAYIEVRASVAQTHAIQTIRQSNVTGAAEWSSHR